MRNTILLSNNGYNLNYKSNDILLMMIRNRLLVVEKRNKKINKVLK